MKLVYIMGDRQDHTLGSHIVYVTDWGNKNSFWHRAWRMAGIHALHGIEFRRFMKKAWMPMV